MVREGYFTWRGVDISPEQPRIAGGVMGSAERPLRDQRLPRRKQSDDAVDFGCLQSFFQRQGRQDGRQSFGQHRLAGPRRTDEQHVVTTSGGDFQRPLDRFLSFDFREIQFLLVRLAKKFGNIHLDRFDGDFPFQKAGRFAQVLDRNDLQPLDDGGFGGIISGHKQSSFAISSRPQRDRQDPFDHAHGAGQSELTDEDKLWQPIALKLFAGR